MRRRPFPGRELLAGALLALAVLSAYLLSSGGDFYISDGEVEFMATAALLDGRTLAIPPGPRLAQIMPGADGRYYSKYGFGMTLVSAPFYAAAVLVSHAVPAADRYLLTRLFVSLLPAFCAALAVCCFYALSLAYHSLRRSVLLALLLAFTTLLWPYSRVLFPEALIALCLLLAALVAVRGSPRSPLPAALLAGGLVGLAYMTRPAALVYLPGVLWLVLVHSEKRRRIPALAGFLAAIALFAAAQGFITFYKFGDPFFFGYSGSGEYFGPTVAVGLYGLLFSAGRSLFLYAPLCLLALWAWAGFAREERRDALGLALLIAIPFLFYAAWSVWHGGWAWGPRYLVPIVPFLLLPLPYLWDRRGRIWLSAALALLGLGVNLLGVAVDFNRYYAAMTRLGDQFEQMLLFVPRYSPIAGHLRLLLAGQTIPLAVTHLSQHGLPWDLPWLAPLLILALTASSLSLLSLCRPPAPDPPHPT